MTARDAVKVALPLEDGLTGYEMVWAWPENGGYVVDNVPLLAFGVSIGEVIEAVERDGVLTFAGVLRRGGHSTYRVAFPADATEEDRTEALGPLKMLGCDFDRGPSRMVAIDVPPQADVYDVYSVLQTSMQEGRWTFEEGHCGHPLREARPD